jgi:excisionase family DNA binding protein
MKPPAKRPIAPPRNISDRLISITDAAHYLGCDPMTVRNMIKDGRLKAYTLGPRVLRIRLSDIDCVMSPPPEVGGPRGRTPEGTNNTPSPRSTGEQTGYPHSIGSRTTVGGLT